MVEQRHYMKQIKTECPNQTEFVEEICDNLNPDFGTYYKEFGYSCEIDRRYGYKEWSLSDMKPREMGARMDLDDKCLHNELQVRFITKLDPTSYPHLYEPDILAEYEGKTGVMRVKSDISRYQMHDLLKPILENEKIRIEAEEIKDAFGFPKNVKIIENKDEIGKGDDLDTNLRHNQIFVRKTITFKIPPMKTERARDMLETRLRTGFKSIKRMI